MQYLGGKSRLAGKFAPILQESIDRTDGFLEPFVGGFNVAPKLRLDRTIFRDAHVGLIEMYRAVENGWTPPTDVSEEEYRRLKSSEVTSPLKTFVSFACSWGGKEWGGYARGDAASYAANARNSLLRVFPLQYSAEFQDGSYRDSVLPEAERWTIYCDPPYQKTTRYRGKSGDFDSPAFFQWCDEMASDGHHVYVSEFSAPDRWEVVWEKERVENLSGKSNKRVERLYRVPG